MTIFNFEADRVKFSYGQWTAELCHGEEARLIEIIDAEALIEELKSRGYTVTKDEE